MKEQTIFPLPPGEGDKGKSMNTQNGWVRDHHAFTLIEVLISISLLVVITVSFSYLFSLGAKNIKSSREFAAALNEAQAQMEIMRATKYENLTSKLFDGNRGIVQIIPRTADLMEIRLQYTYSDNQKPIVLYALRSKY